MCRKTVQIFNYAFARFWGENIHIKINFGTHNWLGHLNKYIMAMAISKIEHILKSFSMKLVYVISNLVTDTERLLKSNVSCVAVPNELPSSELSKKKL